MLVAADYSQIELRLLAHFSRDAALIAAFRDGADVHARTAARIHGCAVDAVTPEMRAAAKTVNFGVLYGMGARGLADRLGIELEAAKRFIADYFASYPDVRRTTQAMVETARATGFATTLLGRRLALPEITSPNPGQCRRHHQGRDGAGGRGLAAGETPQSDDPASPRRTRLRRSGGRSRHPACLRA
jgi:DNA polymerase-1